MEFRSVAHLEPLCTVEQCPAEQYEVLGQIKAMTFVPSAKYRAKQLQGVGQNRSNMQKQRDSYSVSVNEVIRKQKDSKRMIAKETKEKKVSLIRRVHMMSCLDKASA